MIINQQKLTAAFCRGRILAFLPKAQGEAAIIQNHFFKMGYSWKTGGTTIQHLDHCVTHGMAVMDNRLYTHPYELGNLNNIYLCTVEQLADNYVSPADMFNKLSKRIEELEAQLQPKKLDKPFLKNPAPGE